MFRTSGCLIWQLNDCWPVISWALIDYGLNPKAAYYYVKRACQPVIAPLIVREGRVEVYIINETAANIDASLKLEVMAFSGEILCDEIVQKTVPAYTSSLALHKELDDLPLKSNCLLVSSLESGGRVLNVDVRTAVEPKNLKLPVPQIEVAVKAVDDRTFEATFESPVYTKAVKLELAETKARFSDNFFDLLPHRKKTVTVQLEQLIDTEQFVNRLKWQSYPYKAAD